MKRTELQENGLVVMEGSIVGPPLVGFEDTDGSNDGFALGSTDTDGLNECSKDGSVLGFEDVDGFNDGKALGLTDTDGANE